LHGLISVIGPGAMAHLRENPRWMRILPARNALRSGWNSMGLV